MNNHTHTRDDIRGRLNVTGLESPALHTHTIDRMSAALDQHVEHVEQAEIRFTDVNGPRGGWDKICRAQVRLRGHAALRIQQAGDDAYTLASAVADRVKQAVGRLVDKRLETRRLARGTVRG